MHSLCTLSYKYTTSPAGSAWRLITCCISSCTPYKRVYVCIYQLYTYMHVCTVVLKLIYALTKGKFVFCNCLCLVYSNSRLSLFLCVSLKALWQIPIYGFQLDLFLPKNLSGILSVDIKLKYWNLLSLSLWHFIGIFYIHSLFIPCTDNNNKWFCTVFYWFRIFPFRFCLIYLCTRDKEQNL